MRLRDATPQDRDAIHRTWLDAAWLDEGDEDDDEQFARFHDAASWVVGELDDGRTEASASWLPGEVRHVDTDLPFAGVTSVNVGRVARGQGLASGVTALVTARAADAGAAVAGLGIFDQGFYDKVGYGTLAPWVIQRFDPAQLQAPWGHRPPLRLTAKDDGERIHRAIERRRRVHGAVTFSSVDRTVVELGWTSKGVGLGYADDDGELTHLLWMSAKGEHGPYRVSLPVFRTGAQLRELLSLLKSLSGQVRLAIVDQPADLSIQELLRNPHRTRPREDGTGAGDIPTKAAAWHQARILDVEACVGVVRATREVTFVAEVDDPLTAVLERAGGAVDEQPTWRGIGGRWAITLGAASSGAERLDEGGGADLPVLRTTVNELTRLWFGVRPPTQLAMVGDVEAPDDLLEALDDALRLPVPHFDMDF